MKLSECLYAVWTQISLNIQRREFKFMKNNKSDALQIVLFICGLISWLISLNWLTKIQQTKIFETTHGYVYGSMIN